METFVLAGNKLGKEEKGERNRKREKDIFFNVLVILHKVRIDK